MTRTTPLRVKCCLVGVPTVVWSEYRFYRSCRLQAGKRENHKKCRDLHTKHRLKLSDNTLNMSVNTLNMFADTLIGLHQHT